MSKNPVTIERESNLLAVFDILRKHEFRRLPVVVKGRFVGLVSISDLYRYIDPISYQNKSLTPGERRKLVTLPTEHIMQTMIFWCEPESTIAEAAQLMREHKIGFLPVLRDGVLVGVISDSDLFMAMSQFFSEQNGRLVSLRIPADQAKKTYEVVGKIAAKHSVTIVTYALTPTQAEARAAGQTVTASQASSATLSASILVQGPKVDDFAEELLATCAHESVS